MYADTGKYTQVIRVFFILILVKEYIEIVISVYIKNTLNGRQNKEDGFFSSRKPTFGNLYLILSFVSKLAILIFFSLKYIFSGKSDSQKISD